jgi:hypothetical protein
MDELRHAGRRLAPLLAIVAALALAACNATPAASLLTDPKAILGAAVTSAAAAGTVHVDAVASGTLPIDLTGTGAAGTGIDLTGTTASLDADLPAGATRATFVAPGLLGLRGELIALDGSSYIKTTLTGPLYQRQSAGVPDELLPSADPAAMLGGLQDLLAQPGVDPVKGADVPCGTGTCYTVEIELTPAELAALGAGTGDLPLPADLPIPIPSLDEASVALTFRVDQVTNALSGLTAVVDLGGDAPATLDLTFTKWGDAVTVSAPPADQIAPGS